jgi:phosphoenolpyruvate---glycerone phosphotransferase subunit DhaL
MGFDAAKATAWLTSSAAEIAAAKDELTRLDAAIGDADHGSNMARGFTAVLDKLAGAAEDAGPGKRLVLSGGTLISKVGGASGPLWGSFFRAAGKAMGDAAEVDDATLVEALGSGLDAVRGLGGAEVGDKTMVDALAPAVEAARSRLAAGDDLAASLAAAATAAREGSESTIPIVARKGRASYLGERSAGHKDPGSASAAILIGTLAAAVAG